MKRLLPIFAPIFAVACLGYLRVLNTWWFHDDWYFLADAAGVVPRGETLVRFVSYQWYWRLFYPLFGLATLPWGLTRLIVHAGSGVLVARLAGRAGLNRTGQVLTGVLFVAWPTAFESLYWGTGMVELLGAMFTLWALERWFSAGSRNQILALVLGALAVCSKESGILLPAFFVFAMLRSREKRPAIWAGICGLVALGVWMGFLVAQDLQQATDYQLTLTEVPRNLLLLGYWLVVPSPLQRAGFDFSWAVLAIGALFWLGWLLTAWRGFRKGDLVPAVCLVGMALAVGPATSLGDHVGPRYVYLGSAFLVFGLVHLLVPRNLELPGPAVGLVTILITLGVWTSTSYHLDHRFLRGRPVHGLVAKSDLSERVCDGLRQLSLSPQERLVFFLDQDVPPVNARLIQDTMGDDRAVRLLLGSGVDVEWVDSLGEVHIGAYVIAVHKGLKLEPMGRYRPGG